VGTTRSAFVVAPGIVCTFCAQLHVADVTSHCGGRTLARNAAGDGCREDLLFSAEL
jgi:hypothetical protein